MTYFPYKSASKERGITLLIAFLIMTLSFSLASGIFTLLLSEFELAGEEALSVRAFYAADSGFECARYYDERNTTSSLKYFDPGSGPQELRCGNETAFDPDGHNINVAEPSPGTHTFVIHLANETCAEVIVTKVDTPLGGGIIRRTTEIQSKGRARASGANCEGTTKTVERALRAVTIERVKP